MKIVRVTQKNLHLYEEGLRLLESEITYPLGDQFFKISHGADYLRFFQRLGEPHLYVFIDKNKIAGVGCAVLRTLTDRSGHRKKVWYLCDLKIREEYRGQGWTLKLMGSLFLAKYLLCRRAYAISMNPANVSENKVLKLLKKFRWAAFSSGGLLSLFSLNSEEFKSAKDLLEKEFRGFGITSLSGMKDLLMQPEEIPLALLHIQPGETQTVTATINKETVYMFCLPEAHPLGKILSQQGIKPSATATIVHHRMQNFNWDFIRTSDI